MSAFLVLSSCGAESAEKYHYEVRKDLSVYFTNADSVIASVRGAMKRRSEKIIINYDSHGDNMEDIADIVSEIMGFAVSETDMPDEGDYIGCQTGGYSVSYSRIENGGKNHYEIIITPDYFTDADMEEKVDEKISVIIGGFGFDENTSDYEKVCAVCDHVRNNIEFDNIHKKNSHYHLKSTAYGALINKHAVCQGYAVTVYRLLREAGINCRVITGMAYDDEIGSEYHAWNIAEIDGLYYNIDMTWDDRLGTDKYFLKCEEDFEAHIRDEKFMTDEFLAEYPMSGKSFIAE